MKNLLTPSARANKQWNDTVRGELWACRTVETWAGLTVHPSTGFLRQAQDERLSLFAILLNDFWVTIYRLN